MRHRAPMFVSRLFREGKPADRSDYNRHRRYRTGKQREPDIATRARQWGHEGSPLNSPWPGDPGYASKRFRGPLN